MEEKQKQTESNFFTCLCSSPLFSAIFTFYALILLYFPAFLHGLCFSPVLISTSLLLLYLLRLGANQNSDKEKGSDSQGSDSPEIDSTVKLSPQDENFCDHDLHRVSCESKSDPNSKSDPVPKFLTDCFVEWDVRAPLDVIHEECEAEGGGNEGFWEEKRETQMAIIEKYGSLSLYYPSDTETSSEGDSPAIDDWETSENLCFRWEEDDREGMIEIELDGKRNSSEVDEENLIEIDLFPLK